MKSVVQHDYNSIILYNIKTSLEALVAAFTLADGTLTIDVTDEKALLVRRNDDTGDIFTVDTDNETIIYNDGNEATGYVLTTDSIGVANWTDPTTLSVSQSTTLTGPWSGALTSNANITLLKTGRQVTMMIGFVSSTVEADGFLIYDSIPVGYRPIQNCEFLIRITAATSVISGRTTIDTNGVITIYRNVTGTTTYTAGIAIAIHSPSLSWITA